MSHNKGSTVDIEGARQTQAPWEDFYEFTGTKLEEFPLPATLPLARGRRLDELAQATASDCARRRCRRPWLQDDATSALAASCLTTRGADGIDCGRG